MEALKLTGIEICSHNTIKSAVFTPNVTFVTPNPNLLHRSPEMKDRKPTHKSPGSISN